MITNKLKIKTLSQSFLYTDYYCEFVKYKNKKFKIIVKPDRNRIEAHIYLLTNNGLCEIATGSDFKYNIRDFDIDDTTSKNKKGEFINKQLKYAKEFITLIF